MLLEKLGSGGAAEAWRAIRISSLIRDEVCLKLLLRPTELSARRALLEEARLLSRVRHANVVSLIDVSEDGRGGVFLVLEFVRGVDLRRLGIELARRGERLTAGAVAAIGVALCRALGAAQRAGLGSVVHRDVTPHNVLVSGEGEIKLADFGVARACDRECWTAAGTIKGKTGYVSPEQARGEALDVRSDLFAVGIMLFELLAGSRPFLGSGRVSTLKAIAAAVRPPLRTVAPGVPAPLVTAVESLLEHDRERRPPTAEQAARMLARCTEEQAAIDELRRCIGRVRGARPGRDSPRKTGSRGSQRSDVKSERAARMCRQAAHPNRLRRAPEAAEAAGSMGFSLPWRAGRAGRGAP